MATKQTTLVALTVKTIVIHTLTYFLMGVLAVTFLDYAERFTRPDMVCWMRPTTDPIVMAGVLFQPLRGLVFGLVFFPLRDQLFDKQNGWLLMWWLLIGLGIISTFGPTPGSIEGLVYTVIPWTDQLIGWLEVAPQALLLSLGLWAWVRYADNRWLNWILGLAFAIVILLPILGLMVTMQP
jgi:hypothetical protein